MSQGERISRKAALPIVNELLDLLRENTHSVTVCGSLRRNKPDVGDVDIVIHPHNANEYLSMMDEHVHLGWYGHGLNDGGRESWGNTKRLINYRGINFDVIIADEHQLGYKIWLSTGPSMANQAMMVLLKQKLSPLRMIDGYCWHVTYDRTHPKYEKANSYARLAKLNVTDEVTFFKLIGMQFCHPEWRDEKFYRQNLWKNGQPPKELLEAHYVEEAKPISQQSLF